VGKGWDKREQCAVNEIKEQVEESSLIGFCSANRILAFCFNKKPKDGSKK
jgi:hypothetical protein